MFEQQIRCPICHKLIGKTNTNEKSTAKVLAVAPKIKTTGTNIIENKCPKCKSLVYVELINNK